jgi:hypothetical protein
MTQLHGPDHGKQQFLLDSDALARVVGTAVGAALAQLEDTEVQERHQQVLDAVAALRPAQEADAPGCELGVHAVHECDNTYQGSGDVRWAADMRQVPSEQVYSTKPCYGGDEVLRAAPSEEREEDGEPGHGMRRGGVHYPTQEDVEEPTPGPVPDDASGA